MLTQFETTCFHEAAHAVVSYLSPTLPPIRFVRVSADGSGVVEHYPRSADWRAETIPGLRLRIHEGLRVLNAGTLGQFFATGTSCGYEADFLKIRNLVVADAAVPFIWAETPPRRLSDAEVEKALDGATARWRESWYEAVRLVRSNWAACERIAAAIVTCGGVISGRVVDALIGADGREKTAELDALSRALDAAAKEPPRRSDTRGAIALEDRMAEIEAHYASRAQAMTATMFSRLRS